jgi:hypothetical protein
MDRMPGGRRAISSLLASLLLMAIAIAPGSPLRSDVSAEVPVLCTAGEVEFGIESFTPPVCYLDIVLDESTFPGPGGDGIIGSVPAGQDFTFDVLIREFVFDEVATDDCASASTITVELWPSFGEPEGPSDTWTETAAAGVATFTESVGEPGVYYLTASAEVPAECATDVWDAPPTDDFEVTEPGIVVVCGAEPCDGTLTSESGGTTATIHAGPGATITASFSSLDEAEFTQCKNFPPRDADGVLTFDVTGGGSKTITFVVDGSNQSKICWNQPTTFLNRSGKPAPADPLGGFTDFLPGCDSKAPAGPCILKTESSTKDANKPATTIEVLGPPGDPKMY